MNPPDSGGIIRTAKDRHHPYKVMNTTFATDERLSWEARGLMAYLLEKPDDWQVRFNDLLKKAPDCKRYKLRGILHKLEQFGYLVRVRERGARGQFTWVSTVYETPRSGATIGQKLTDGAKQPDPIGEGSAPSVNSPPVAEPPAVDPPAENRPIYMGMNTTKYEGGEGGAARPAHDPLLANGKRPTSDPNQTHPACLAYLELTGYRPAKVNAAAIAQAVDRDEASLVRWRGVVERWVKRGNRYNNVEGMLEWYARGEGYESRNRARPERRAGARTDRTPSTPFDFDHDI